jgi:hypothetical protein
MAYIQNFYHNASVVADNTGQVGIGTLTPNQRLDVAGNIVIPYSNALLMDTVGAAGSNFIKTINSFETIIGTGRGAAGFAVVGNTDIRLGFGTAYTAAQTDLIITNASGHVGIGISTPGSKLEVNGTINFNSSGDRGFICNPGAGTFLLGDMDDVGGGAYINGDGTYINYYAGGVITGRLEDDGTLTVIGDMVAYGSPSDKRLKENIKPIESALDKAMKLQGVTFDWKESDSLLDIKEDIGFIAQDVQKVVPELVRENNNGMLSMRHQGITPILLEAIKELKAEIDLLKSKPCTCNKCNCNI